MRATILATILAIGTQAEAHIGGLDKQGCHAGSKPFHCHKAQKSAPKAAADRKVISGTITHALALVDIRADLCCA